jgi:hypothetical protein
LSRPHRLGVEVLDRRVLPQPCELQSADEPLVLAFDSFAINQQGEPLLEGEGGDIGLTSLLLKGFRHAGEPERGETLLRWMCKHGGSSSPAC